MKDNLDLIIVGWLFFGIVLLAAYTLLTHGCISSPEFATYVLLATIVVTLMHFWFEVREAFDEIKEICRNEVSNFS